MASVSKFPLALLKCSLRVCLHALSTAIYFGILQKVPVKELPLHPSHVCFNTEGFAGSRLSPFTEDPVRAIKTISGQVIFSQHSHLENIRLFSRSCQISLEFQDLLFLN